MSTTELNKNDIDQIKQQQPTVPRAGIEPATQGFSVPCSTN